MTSPAFDLIGLTQLRNDPRYRKIDGGIDKGKNLAVVVIDTGIQGDHLLLDENFEAYVNFTEDASTPPTVIEVPFISSDEIGHGTHVAGIIGSEDESIGVATGVDLISLQVFSRNTLTFEQDIVKALQWVLDKREQYNIVAVNMSLGEGLYTSSDRSNSDYIDIVNKLEQEGITIVSAAGNYYAEQFEPEQNVMSPAIFSTLAVGAVYQDDYPFDSSGNFSNSVEQDEITEFSQRLKFESMIFAPGAYINSTVPGNGTDDYRGTSMASPMVAGAVALLQEAALQFGGRKLTPYEVREILLETADEITDGDTEDFNPTGETFKRMNIYKAVQKVERERPFSSVTPDTNPNPDPNPNDPNGIISRATSLESDNNIVLEQLTELTTVASDSIGIDEGTIEVGGTDQNGTITELKFSSQPSENTDTNGIKADATLIKLTPGTTTKKLDESIGSDSEIKVNNADVDLFKFVATETGSLLIETDTTSYNNNFADTYLRLFDADGIEIDYNDDFDDFTTDSFLSASVKAGATYFIGVSGYGNDSYSIDNLKNRSAEDTGGSYNLYVTYITPHDKNGTITEARQFNLGNPINGKIGFDGSTNVGAYDVDFYKINSAQSGLLDINIDAFEGNSFPNPVDSMVFLFDEQGNQLDSNDDSPFSLDSELQYLIYADTDYYLAVSGYGNFDFKANEAVSGTEGETGDYTLNARVLQAEVNNSDNIYVKAFKDVLNNALKNEDGSFSNLSLDVDRKIFGPNLSQIKTDDLNYLKLGTSITASLGEDVIGSANSGNPNREFSSFSTLYRTEVSNAGASFTTKPSEQSNNPITSKPKFPRRAGASNLVSLQIFGGSLNSSFNSGADDVDYFRIRIDSPGRYDLQTLAPNIGSGSLGANTILRLYDDGGNQISDNENTVSFPGIDSRVLVSIEKPGDYWIAVLPEAEATERFDFQSHSFGTLTDEEKQQLSQSTGEYRLLANRFTLQNISTPVLRDGAISVEFNDVLNKDRLKLYDASDAETFDSSSLTVVDSKNNSVRGSLVVEENKVIFVPTNPLNAGTYTLTYNSNDFITQFGSENTQPPSQ